MMNEALRVAKMRLAFLQVAHWEQCCQDGYCETLHKNLACL